MNKEIRDNARLIVDDIGLAQELWLRAQSLIPATINWSRALGLNERWRFYRYDAGQKFAPHRDGFFRRPNGNRSHLTFMVYLNAGYTGGEPIFTTMTCMGERATEARHGAGLPALAGARGRTHRRRAQVQSCGPT